jgi:hypothetical protein
LKLKLFLLQQCPPLCAFSSLMDCTYLHEFSWCPSVCRNSYPTPLSSKVPLPQARRRGKSVFSKTAPTISFEVSQFTEPFVLSPKLPRKVPVRGPRLSQNYLTIWSPDEKIGLGGGDAPTIWTSKIRAKNGIMGPPRKKSSAEKTCISFSTGSFLWNLIHKTWQIENWRKKPRPIRRASPYPTHPVFLVFFASNMTCLLHLWHPVLFPGSLRLYVIIPSYGIRSYHFSCTD